MTTIRVQVAIDSFLVRSAVATALSSQEGIEVVGQTDDGAHGAALAAALRPQVIVLSGRFGQPPEEWIGLYRTTAPKAKIVLVLISHRAVDLPGWAGADAAIDAGEGIAELAAAVRSVALRFERHRPRVG